MSVCVLYSAGGYGFDQKIKRESIDTNSIDKLSKNWCQFDRKYTIDSQVCWSIRGFVGRFKGLSTDSWLSTELLSFESRRSVRILIFRSILVVWIHTFLYSDVLRKKAVCTFDSCKIPLHKMFICVETYEYALLKFPDNLELMANKIFQDFGGKIFPDFPENSTFNEGNKV